MKSINLSERIDPYFPQPESNCVFNPSIFIEMLILMQHEDKALSTILSLDTRSQASFLGD